MTDQAKAPAGAPQKVEKAACIDCGQKYDPGTEANRFYQTSEGIRCAKKAACRARIMGDEFDRRGLKQWGRRTQQQLLILMDPPPKNWDRTKKWESVNDSMERVLAAIEYSSLCYPVCLFQAVQTDADGEPMKDPYTGDWLWATHRSVGEILGLHQSTVSRAILDAKLRHRADYDDGRTWIVLDPKSLSISERDACTRHAEAASASKNGQGDANDPAVAGYRALLPSGRKYLAHSLSILPPDACTRLHAVAVKACSFQNFLFSDARALSCKTVVDACKEECTRAGKGDPDAWHGEVSLLSRVREWEEEPPSTSSSSSSTEEPVPAYSHRSDDDDEGETPLEQLHAAGFGKGALSKLDRPRPVLPGEAAPEPPPVQPAASRPPAENPDPPVPVNPPRLVSQPRSHQPAVPSIDGKLLLAALREYGVAVDDQALMQLIRRCQQNLADATEEEMVAMVHRKGRLAGRKDNPMGFLLTAIPNMFLGENSEVMLRRRRPSDPSQNVGATVAPLPPEDPSTEWAKAKALLRSKISAESYRNWFDDTRQLLRDGDVLSVVTMDPETNGWLETEYAGLIAAVLAEIQPGLTVHYVTRRTEASGG